MLQAGARLCKCLGEEFVPYLGVVMPPLLTTAELKPDILVKGESDSEADEEDDDEVLPMSHPFVKADFMGFPLACLGTELPATTEMT